eukprot:1387890-Lingulodinium_polyedra.AAC.1
MAFLRSVQSFQGSWHIWLFMTTEANWSLASQKPFKTLFGGSSAGLPSSSAASRSAPGPSTSSGPQ